MIAFLDACALIYLIEGKVPFAGRVQSKLAEAARAHPGLEVAVSRLTWLESRVGPLKQHDHPVLALYDAFFAQQGLVWVELNRDVVELATVIRVRHGLRTPDALQAASCLQLGQDHLFFTGDAVFQKVAGLNVAVLA
ncbi:type II toxin-antitoxin system VapC family toxin [Castellaniella sp.]|uniref:type II toxin-antitoxin system VapC family toxin n=1 Tax=Castellaniella sp. TaxID=1955812 RepID=UPI003C774B0A